MIVFVDFVLRVFSRVFLLFNGVCVVFGVVVCRWFWFVVVWLLCVCVDEDLIVGLWLCFCMLCMEFLFVLCLFLLCFLFVCIGFRF